MNHYQILEEHQHRPSLSSGQYPRAELGRLVRHLLNGTLGDYLGMRQHPDPKIRDNQWLILAPVDHELTPMQTQRVGQLHIGGEAWSYDFVQRFFDHHLKGIDDGFSAEPKVKYFVMGDNVWRHEHEWPLARTQYTPYYLHADGLLSTNEPREEEPDEFTYDPHDPIRFARETDLWRMARDLQDRAMLQLRDDVLLYDTDSLANDVEMTGPITMTLYARTSAQDTDFTVTLVDVFPNGYCHLIQERIVRSRHHTGKEELLEPGKIYGFKIDVWATSYVIQQGHSLRAEVSSSNFDRYDRNPNTGETFGTGTETIVARQIIYHDALHPSHILLPIIPKMTR